MNEAKHTIGICVAGACQGNFCKDTVKAAEKELGVKAGNTSEDGIQLKECGCLGNCEEGPSVSIDEDLHGKMFPKKMVKAIKELRKES